MFLLFDPAHHDIIIGVIHKPRGHGRGRGHPKDCITYIYKLSLIKWSTKGGVGAKNVQKSVHVVYDWSLILKLTVQLSTFAS